MDPNRDVTPDDMTALDALASFVHRAAIDEMILRLAGLSEEARRDESIRLTNAIFAEMEIMGHEVGLVEKTVVLATLRAAMVDLMKLQIGSA
jgi:hypothetical protein